MWLRGGAGMDVLTATDGDEEEEEEEEAAPEAGPVAVTVAGFTELLL